MIFSQISVTYDFKLEYCFFLPLLVLRAPLSLWRCCNVEYVSVFLMFFWQSLENVCMNLATWPLFTSFWDEGLTSLTLRINHINAHTSADCWFVSNSYHHLYPPSTHDPAMSENNCLNSHVHPLWELENMRSWHMYHPWLGFNDTVYFLRTTGKSASWWQ